MSFDDVRNDMSLKNMGLGSMSEDNKLKVLTDSSATQRLDCALVNRALAESRTIAQRLIKAGAVSVTNRTITKPSFLVNNSEEIIIKKSEKLEKSEYCLKYVSRGALKLEGAFDAFSKYGLSTSNSTRALDIGASTGGFCDVLLQKGVDKVIALDVGHGQLHPKIANDPRVIEMSGVNIRDVYEENLPYKPNLIVSDVSFISLTLVIPTIARIAEQNADIVLLVKPQFEVGKGNLGKGGIVTDESLRIKALENVKNCAKANNLTIIATEKSPIEGTHGNIEYLLYARFAS